MLSCAAMAPIAQHRGGDAQLACDLDQRPTAARQQGDRLPLELIRKMTPFLTHSTPFRSRRSLAKVSTNSGEAHFHRIRHYGFLGNRHRDEKLALCRRLLAISAAAPPDDVDEPGPPQDRNFDTCPCCGGRMEMVGPLPRSCPADPPVWHD